ncbi:MAG: proliferating cell nuclear antigen (pcna) [Candidatus Lokiarchaeota archaeon]|nr:proliferating cell nuclear antigen (pcna) [Candidatus Lokiarchaeota archaeon]
MFECKFHSGQFFKTLVDTISSFIEDGALMAKPDGLELRAIEQSRVAMIDLSVSRDMCETYECDEEVELKINFNDLSKFVRGSSGSEEVFLRYIAETNKLQIKFKGKSTRTFSIPLLEEVTCESIENVNLSSEIEIVLDTSVLSTAIKDADLVGEVVNFMVQQDNNQFSLEANSERGDVQIEFEEEPVRNDADGDVTATYSLDFLTKILKASSLSDQVILEFSLNNPIILTFLIENEESNGKVAYFLAPQVREEEELEEEEEYDEEDDEEEM